MGMSDTAEYWWDIKNRTPYNGIYFTHIPKSTCGHIRKETGNTNTSEYLNDINCFACLELIKQNGNIYNLKEGISRREQSAIEKDNFRFRFGKCNCGSPMQEKINSKTGQKFLGCIQYPKCKFTKNIG